MASPNPAASRPSAHVAADGTGVACPKVAVTVEVVFKSNWHDVLVVEHIPLQP